MKPDQRGKRNNMTDSANGRVYDETIFASPELQDGQRMILHAERLVPVTTRVRGQLAKITRRTVIERKTFEVDVAHEELVVTYEPGDGTPMTGGEPETWRVLLHAEEVVVTKQVRVVEEIVLSTRSVTEMHEYRGTRRHEELEFPTGS